MSIDPYTNEMRCTNCEHWFRVEALDEYGQCEMCRPDDEEDEDA